MQIFFFQESNNMVRDFSKYVARFRRFLVFKRWGFLTQNICIRNFPLPFRKMYLKLNRCSTFSDFYIFRFLNKHLDLTNYFLLCNVKTKGYFNCELLQAGAFSSNIFLPLRMVHNNWMFTIDIRGIHKLRTETRGFLNT